MPTKTDAPLRDQIQDRIDTITALHQQGRWSMDRKYDAGYVAALSDVLTLLDTQEG